MEWNLWLQKFRICDCGANLQKGAWDDRRGMDASRAPAFWPHTCFLNYFIRFLLLILSSTVWRFSQHNVQTLSLSSYLHFKWKNKGPIKHCSCSSDLSQRQKRSSKTKKESSKKDIFKEKRILWFMFVIRAFSSWINQNFLGISVVW